MGLFKFCWTDALTSTVNKNVSITCTGSAINSSSSEIICKQELEFDGSMYAYCEVNGGASIKWGNNGGYTTYASISSNNNPIAYNISKSSLSTNSSGYGVSVNFMYDSNYFYIRGYTNYKSGSDITYNKITVSSCNITAVFYNKTYIES